MAINKVVDSFDEAVKDFFDGATVLIGGFGTPGGARATSWKPWAGRGRRS